MHTAVVLIVLAATILVALSQLQWQRPVPLRMQPPHRSARAPEQEVARPPAGSGLAGLVAWAGLAVATLACLGHFVAPAADPFWLALIAAAIATVPTALAAPAVEARWQRRRTERPQGSLAELSASCEQPEEREQRDRGSAAE